MSIYYWDAGFDGEIEGMFFGTVDVGASQTSDPKVLENREQCVSLFEQSPQKLITAEQVHSADIIHVTNPDQIIGKADALITSLKAIAIGVVTADCVPVLLSGDINGAPIIAAVHAGSKGARDGIIQKTIQTLKDKGATNIKAAIGPCIHVESYEVSENYRDDYIAIAPDSAPFFIEQNCTNPKRKNIHYNLFDYIKFILKKDDVDFTAINENTYTSDHCFSYRRATHEGAKSYKRQLSTIMIKA